MADRDGKELEISVTSGVASEPSQTPEAPEDSKEPETPEGSQTPGTPEQTPSAPEQTPPANAPAPAPAFPDTEGHWAVESIRKAAEKGLVSGYGDGTFRPDLPVTRKQMAVILWRMAEKPQPAGASPFKDLEGCSEEFRTAIAWGYGAGLINGTGADTFSPDAALTRQAAMKLLFGAAGGQAGPEALLYTTYDGAFKDSAQISDWAREAMYWGVYNGILNGDGGMLKPGGTVTRAQLSAILTRYLERGE